MLHIDSYMTAYILLVTGILGAVFGSFINCMAWRMAHGENVIKGRSHCVACGHSLGVLDLIPIFGYIFLKGKCRYCGEKISPRYMLTEVLMAAAFISIVWRYDVSVLALRYLVLVCILLGVALVDLEIYEIPNRLIFAGIIWWLLTIWASGEPVLTEVTSGLFGGFVIGGCMLLISLIFDKVMKKESLGGGDIKLFFLVGLYLGLFGNLLNVMVSCIIGIFFVIGLKKNRIPFGPAISLATWFCILWGERIVTWYIGLF